MRISLAMGHASKGKGATIYSIKSCCLVTDVAVREPLAQGRVNSTVGETRTRDLSIM